MGGYFRSVDIYISRVSDLLTYSTEYIYIYVFGMVGIEKLFCSFAAK